VKIAWCTPFAVESAIGGVSALAVDAIRREGAVDVDIWYPAGAGGRTWPDRGREMSDDIDDRLTAYDAVVYNIGDNPAFHGAIFDVSQKVAGLVVLHDLSLVHLIYNRLTAVSSEYFVATMERWYGAEGRRAGVRALENPNEWLWRPETVQQFPMTEVALENASAVVTHSAYAAEAVARRYVGDVTVLPLPVSMDRTPSDALVDLPVPDDRLLILQAGVVNPNKHVPTVLEAIVEADLVDKVHLIICGYMRAGESDVLHQRIATLDLDRCTTVLGEVSDATLHALRSRADISTVLRHPCGEAASAVLAESLGYGLPIVSVDDGCYREAPAEAVIRVPVPPDAEHVAAALRTWVDDPELRERAADHGRTFVRENHSPESYARGILEALGTAGAAGRRIRLATDLVAIAARAGFASDSSLIERLAGRAHELFSPAPHRLPTSMPPAGEAF
jgi:glycosyltransferase involved in cell wall biosynthesis